jgi:NlpC/P60 family putative phage cell wall peptidase
MHPTPDIVRLARTWLGTPYHHQASVKGAGADCIGLVRGIWREVYGGEPQALPAYTRDWAEAAGQETLLDAARRHLVEIAPAQAEPGAVLVFRWRGAAIAKHAAILATPTTMIHAIEGAPVCEVALSPWWRRHLAGAFAFPGAAPSLRASRGEGRGLPSAKAEGEGQPLSPTAM